MVVKYRNMSDVYEKDGKKIKGREIGKGMLVSSAKAPAWGLGSRA